MEVASATGASLRPLMKWHSIAWKKAHQNVRRLQTCIVKVLEVFKTASCKKGVPGCLSGVRRKSSASF